ncbi:MAG: hypothetical protein K6F52_05435 [Clostridia bacterium]|nr:hypothetical protein [Clostridia bacterium]
MIKKLRKRRNGIHKDSSLIPNFVALLKAPSKSSYYQYHPPEAFPLCPHMEVPMMHPASILMQLSHSSPESDHHIFHRQSCHDNK